MRKIKSLAIITILFPQVSQAQGQCYLNAFDYAQYGGDEIRESLTNCLEIDKEKTSQLQCQLEAELFGEDPSGPTYRHLYNCLSIEPLDNGVNSDALEELIKDSVLSYQTHI